MKSRPHYCARPHPPLAGTGEIDGGAEIRTRIRGRGAKGPPKPEKTCPNCGAPLNVTMVGDCTYCKVKVTTGQFDWVLSRIEQDDVYEG